MTKKCFIAAALVLSAVLSFGGCADKTAVKDDVEVQNNERIKTAITRVYLSPQINGSDEESWNVGIVSYNLDEGVYIAIELEEAYAEEANAIAQNLSIF